MVQIGGKPILWHIMQTYAHHGYKEFVLCLGYKGSVIRDYFHSFAIQNRNFTINLRSGECVYHGANGTPDWQVTLVDTGKDTKTGGRVKRIAPFINEDTFLLTYGDGVTDLDINKTVEFHRSHGKIGTVTGVSPPSRYGELFIEGNSVSAFSEKPSGTGGWINGGYFVFDRTIFDYLDEAESCVLEREPLETIGRKGELMVYQHGGFWQCMDTYRDYTYLSNLWKKGDAPWKRP